MAASAPVARHRKRGGPFLLEALSLALHRTLNSAETRLLLLLSPNGIAKLNHEIIRADIDHKGSRDVIEHCLCELAAVYTEVSQRREIAKQRIAEHPVASKIGRTMKTIATADEMLCLATTPLTVLRKMIDERQRNGDNLDDAVEDVTWEYQQRQLLLQAEWLASHYHKDVTTAQLHMIPDRTTANTPQAANESAQLSGGEDDFSPLRPTTATSHHVVFVMKRLDEHHIKIGWAPVHGWFDERKFDLSTADLLLLHRIGSEGQPTSGVSRSIDETNSAVTTGMRNDEDEDDDEDQLRLMSLKSIDLSAVLAATTPTTLPASVPSTMLPPVSPLSASPCLACPTTSPLSSHGKHVQFHFSASQQELMTQQPPHPPPLLSPTQKTGQKTDNFLPAAFEDYHRRCKAIPLPKASSTNTASLLSDKLVRFKTAALDRIFSTFRRRGCHPLSFPTNARPNGNFDEKNRQWS